MGLLPHVQVKRRNAAQVLNTVKNRDSVIDFLLFSNALKFNGDSTLSANKAEGNGIFLFLLFFLNKSLNYKAVATP